jgi:S1-C subfamily serine protease
VLVRSVGEGGGALKRFDVVTHVGGATVASLEDLERALREHSGPDVEIRVLRRGVTRIIRRDLLGR